MNHNLSAFVLMILTALCTTVSAQSLEPNRLAQTLSGKKLRRSQHTLPAFQLFDVLPDDPLLARSTPFVERSTLVKVRQSDLARLVRRGPELIQLEIPYQEKVITLELYREAPVAPSFVVRTPDGIHEAREGIHYRGIIRNNEQSLVSISLFDNEISGVISSDSTHNLVLGKWTREAGTHVIYREDELTVSMPFDCHTSDDFDRSGDVRSSSGNQQRSAANCVNVYIEASYNLFQEKGSVSSVTNFVTGLFNGVSTIYESEGLSIQMSELYVWNIQDPYEHGSSGAALTSFTQNRPDFNGDLGHLLDYSGSNLGGLANIGVLCSSSHNYAYSDVDNSYSFPAYSWTVNVVAHEIGHNYGSPHTHACKWGPGGNQALDDCYQTEGNCDPGPTPPDQGGTIMSYCHLGADNPGIDFSNGFGQEPGDLLRSRAANASCLGACGTGGSGGCSVAITNIVEDDATCSENNGKLTVQISGAVGVVTYDIGLGAQSSNVFTGLTPGDYNVTVTNGLGCETETAAAIQMLSQKPSLGATVTNASCGKDDGQVELEGSGGTAPYSFRLGGTTSSDPVFTELEPGDYTAIVTDDEGCSTSKDFAIYTDDVPEMEVDVIHTDCGGDNATVDISVSGGQGPFTYLLNGESSQSSTFEGLSAGNYNVAIIDNNDCRVEDQVNIQPSVPITATVLASHTECGLNNGSIDIDASGGAGSLQYSIGESFITSSGFENLPAGTYRVTVKDVNDCIVEMEGVIEPSEGFAVEMASTAAFCGKDNGVLSTSVNGNHGPFSYKLDDGSFTNEAVFDALGPGPVSLTVRDNRGCESTHNVEIQEIEPPVLKPIVDHTHCGIPNGSVETVVEHGVEPYMFTLDTASQPEPLFGNLQSGDYLVKVTDSLGCVDSMMVSVDSSEIVSAQAAVVHTTCGQPNGQIQLEAKSGLGPFQYSIGNNTQDARDFMDLAAGTYTVKVIDADGCTYEEDVDIQSSPGIMMESRFEATTCGNNNGSVIIDASGGTGMLSIALDSTISEDGTFSALSAGQYTAVVADEENCQVQQNIEIMTSTRPVLSALVESTHCGLNNGEIKLKSTQGIGPYRYLVNEALVTNTLVDSLASGVYSIVVMDSMDCVDSTTVGIDNSTAPQLTYMTTDASCYQQNGEIVASGSSGIGPYTYSIGGAPAQDSIFTTLDSGRYKLTLMDQDGCLDTVEVQVDYDDQYRKPELPVETSVCEDQPAQLHSGLDAVPMITWSRDGDILSTDDTRINVMDAGTYRVTATYSEQCILEAETRVVIRENPQFDLQESDTICAGSTFELDTPKSDHVYKWSHGVEGVSIAFPESNSYTLKVINEYGCFTENTIDLTVIQPVSLSGADPVYYSCPGNEIDVALQGAEEYQWFSGDQLIGEASHHTIKVEEDQVLQIVGSNHCFLDTFQMEVVVNQNLTERTGDTMVIEGSPLRLFARNATDITWFSDYEYECDDCTETIIRPEEKGSIAVEYRDEMGCWWSDTIAVDIVPLSDIIPPLVNVITPNQDGRNDALAFAGLDTFQGAGIQVFDQRGVKIYEESDYHNNWDGRLDGDLLPEGVYFYVLTLYLDDRVFQYDSDLTVVRD